MTYLLHSVIFSIITIHMLKTGKILPENILTFTQDARKAKINSSSEIHENMPIIHYFVVLSNMQKTDSQNFNIIHCKKSTPPSLSMLYLKFNLIDLVITKLAVLCHASGGS